MFLQVQAISLAPTAVNWLSLTELMMAEMKDKCRKEKQTDSSAYLSVLVISISLALSLIAGVVLDRHRQVKWLWRYKKYNMWTDVPIFLAQKNTKKSH